MPRHAGVHFRAAQATAAMPGKPATRSPDTPLDYSSHTLGSSALGESSSGSDLNGLAGRVTYELDPQTDELLIKHTAAPVPVGRSPSGSLNEVLALFDVIWFGLSAPDADDDANAAALPSALGPPPQQFLRPPYSASLGGASPSDDERLSASPLKGSDERRMHAASAFAAAAAQAPSPTRLAAAAAASGLSPSRIAAAMASGISLPVAMQAPAYCSTSGSNGSGHAARQHSPAPLGTWAQRRQYLMPSGPGDDQQLEQQQEDAPLLPSGERSSRSSSQQVQQGASAGASGSNGMASHERSQPQPAPSASGRGGDDGGCGDDEAEVAAAWRWRFARRWHQEQVRGPDPAASASADGMEEALQFLSACGERWDMARTMSTDQMLGGSTAEPRLLGTTLSVNTPAQSLLAGELAYEEPSPSGPGPQARGFGRSGSSGGRGNGGGLTAEATREVRGMSRRAAELLQAQQTIDKAVAARWQEVDHRELWVGALLAGVEVDDWGTFRFVLLRLRDRNGRQRFLVRGANYANDARLLDTAHKQMLSAAVAHSVPPEALEQVGSGTMEWRRDRDRHLHIHSGQASCPAGAPGAMTGMEVMNLAGVLTKQHLPMHYKVTVEGGKVL